MTVGAQDIPLVDLAAQYARIEADVTAAIERVLDRGDFVLGEDVRLFESEFAAFCGVAHAVGCASGTDALHLACRTLGVGPGDEVIVPAFTFVATALGVTWAGAKPVLVDVHPDTALIDHTRVEAAITDRTKAIIPVHLYGQCADMDPLAEIACHAGIPLVEDAAQAHGARYRGKRAGSLGAVACFSFYPGKNLGAYGDGGLVATGDGELDERLRVLRNWGSGTKYRHEVIGLNSRLDTLQAAVLRVKLRHLDAWNAERRRKASAYDAALAGIDGVVPTTTSADSVHHVYVVRVADRDAVLGRLHEEGIMAGVHYPFALHELEAYRWLGHEPGAFPVAEDWARRCLSLPIYPELPAGAADRVAGVLARSRR